MYRIQVSQSCPSVRTEKGTKYLLPYKGTQGLYRVLYYRDFGQPTYYGPLTAHELHREHGDLYRAANLPVSSGGGVVPHERRV